MSHFAKAKIRWVPAHEGGRRMPFTGTHYAGVVRFEEDATSWPDQAWSLVVDFDEPPNGAHEMIAKVHFLMPDAPMELLHPGSCFELIEGRRVVARGEILSLIGGTEGADLEMEAGLSRR